MGAGSAEEEAEEGGEHPSRTPVDARGTRSIVPAIEPVLLAAVEDPTAAAGPPHSATPISCRVMRHLRPCLPKRKG